MRRAKPKPDKGWMWEYDGFLLYAEGMRETRKQLVEECPIVGTELQRPVRVVACGEASYRKLKRLERLCEKLVNLRVFLHESVIDEILEIQQAIAAELEQQGSKQEEGK